MNLFGPEWWEAVKQKQVQDAQKAGVIPSTDPKPQDKMIDVENIETKIDAILQDPNTLPALIAAFGGITAYYLATHPEIFKEFIRAAGSIMPDSIALQAEAL